MQLTAVKGLDVGAAVVGLIILTGMSWVFMGTFGDVTSSFNTLSEPRLVQSELLHRLADPHAAAKLLLDACPESDLRGLCARRRPARERLVVERDHGAVRRG